MRGIQGAASPRARIDPRHVASRIQRFSANIAAYLKYALISRRLLLEDLDCVLILLNNKNITV